MPEPLASTPGNIGNLFPTPPWIASGTTPAYTPSTPPITPAVPNPWMGVSTVIRPGAPVIPNAPTGQATSWVRQALSYVRSFFSRRPVVATPQPTPLVARRPPINAPVPMRQSSAYGAALNNPAVIEGIFERLQTGQKPPNPLEFGLPEPPAQQAPGQQAPPMKAPGGTVQAPTKAPAPPGQATRYRDPISSHRIVFGPPPRRERLAAGRIDDIDPYATRVDFLDPFFRIQRDIEEELEKLDIDLFREGFNRSTRDERLSERLARIIDRLKQNDELSELTVDFLIEEGIHGILDRNRARYDEYGYVIPKDPNTAKIPSNIDVPGERNPENLRDGEQERLEGIVRRELDNISKSRERQKGN